jgi:hypothetical protein
MNICDPKTNIAFARDAVKRELLLPEPMTKDLTKNELCNLLTLCKNDRLPAAPFMLEPKKVGNYMIAVYSNSPFTPAEFAKLLARPLPSRSVMQNLADKVKVTYTKEQVASEIKDIIFDKLVKMGIPEPIRVPLKESKAAMANGNMGEVAQNNANVNTAMNNNGSSNVPSNNNRSNSNSNINSAMSNNNRSNSNINSAMSNNNVPRNGSANGNRKALNNSANGNRKALNNSASANGKGGFVNRMFGSGPQRSNAPVYVSGGGGSSYSVQPRPKQVFVTQGGESGYPVVVNKRGYPYDNNYRRRREYSNRGGLPYYYNQRERLKRYYTPNRLRNPNERSRYNRLIARFSSNEKRSKNNSETKRAILDKMLKNGSTPGGFFGFGKTTLTNEQKAQVAFLLQLKNLSGLSNASNIGKIQQYYNGVQRSRMYGKLARLVNDKYPGGLSNLKNLRVRAKNDQKVLSLLNLLGSKNNVEQAAVEEVKEILKKNGATQTEINTLAEAVAGPRVLNHNAALNMLKRAYNKNEAKAQEVLALAIVNKNGKYTEEAIQKAMNNVAGRNAPPPPPPAAAIQKAMNIVAGRNAPPPPPPPAAINTPNLRKAFNALKSKLNNLNLTNGVKMPVLRNKTFNNSLNHLNLVKQIQKFENAGYNWFPKTEFNAYKKAVKATLPDGNNTLKMINLMKRLKGLGKNNYKTNSEYIGLNNSRKHNINESLKNQFENLNARERLRLLKLEFNAKKKEKGRENIIVNEKNKLVKQLINNYEKALKSLNTNAEVNALIGLNKKGSVNGATNISSASPVVDPNNNFGPGLGASANPTVNVASASQSNSTEALSGGNNTLVNVVERYTKAFENRKRTNPNFAVNVNERLKKVLGKLGENYPNKNTNSVKIYKRFIKYLSNGKFNNENLGRVPMNRKEALAIVEEQLKSVLPDPNFNEQYAYYLFEKAMKNAKRRNKITVNAMMKKFNAELAKISGNNANAKTNALYKEYAKKFMSVKTNNGNGKSFDEALAQLNEPGPPTPAQATASAPVNRTKAAALVALADKKINSNLKALINRYNIRKKNPKGLPPGINNTLTEALKLAGVNRSKQIKAYTEALNALDIIDRTIQRSTGVGNKFIQLAETGLPPTNPFSKPRGILTPINGEQARRNNLARKLAMLGSSEDATDNLTKGKTAKEIASLLAELEDAMKTGKKLKSPFKVLINPFFENSLNNKTRQSLFARLSKSNQITRNEVTKFVQLLEPSELNSTLVSLATQGENLKTAFTNVLEKKSLTASSAASTVSNLGSTGSSKTASTVSTKPARSSFKTIVEKNVIPVVRVGGRAVENRKRKRTGPNNGPPAKKTVKELLNNRLERLGRVGQFRDISELEAYVRKEGASNYKPNNFKSQQFTSLLAKYLETIPEESTKSPLNSQLMSLPQTQESKPSASLSRVSSAASTISSTLKRQESFLKRNNFDERMRKKREAEIKKIIKKVPLNVKNTPESLLKKISQQTTLRNIKTNNIHNLYGGGSNGKPFRMGNVYRNAGKEPIAKQFVSATPQIRGRKAAETKKVGENYKITRTNQNIRNWVRSQGETLQQHFNKKVGGPSSWNNISQAFGKVPYFRNHTPTPGTLERLYGKYNKFLEKQVKYYKNPVKSGASRKNEAMKNNRFLGLAQREKARLRMNASRKSLV